ncbi:MAG: tRNA (guanosine(37)-N1)-methyltransferase TrmD [Desulfococcaceae bacterium]
MQYRVLTIFPELFAPFWSTSIVGRAVESGAAEVEAIDIRNFTADRHRTVDDRPYGGGAGMVMKPEPLAAAIRAAKARSPSARVLLLSPQGRPFRQPVARELSRLDGLVFVCGRYEGVDERVCLDLVDEELSVGDFVLTGGELPAMIVMDAVTRLLPGVLGGEGAAENDSFAGGLLEHGHYTRPPEFEGEAVPEILRSGNHAAIDRWRRETALIRTFLKRPDLLRERPLSPEDRAILRDWGEEIAAIVRSQTLSGADSPSGGE